MAQGAGLPGSRLGKINLYRLGGNRNFRFKGPQAKASLLIQQVFTECLCTRQCSRSWGDRLHWQGPKPSWDSFLSFKISLQSLFTPFSHFFPSSLPPPHRPFLLCLSNPLVSWASTLPEPHHSSPVGGSALRGLARPSPVPKGLRTRCPRWCLMRAELSPKPLPHSAHLYGFSPVCVRLCLTRSELRGNSFPQKPHTWGWLGPEGWARTRGRGAMGTGPRGLCGLRRVDGGGGRARSPRWVRRCLTRAELSAKPLPHSGHR